MTSAQINMKLEYFPASNRERAPLTVQGCQISNIFICSIRVPRQHVIKYLNSFEERFRFF